MFEVYLQDCTGSISCSTPGRKILKRLSLIVVSSILAVAVLFGSLMGQTSTAHAATIPHSTQRAATLNDVQALISKIELYVHVADHHATVDSKLQSVVSQEQFQVVRQAVSAYNTSSVSTKQVSDSHAVSKTISRSSSSYWYACYYISNGTMDTIAWAIIFGGAVAAIVGILAAETGVGVAVAIAGVLLGFGGAYLLWYSDKYWPNGTTWCVDNYGDVWYYAD